ncbi:heterokaryon incompatibility protein-domain-containing protein, partial [Hyaloscypha sp. PMI_1271]
LVERSYIYDPLNFQRQQLRIVTLLPGRRSTPLECTIATVDLGSDELVYEALSYEWGDPAGARMEILLDGRRFLVRKNLWSAMKHIRNRTKMRRLWIDAICINQEDLSERSHQVGLMGDIYRKAESVIAWLGEKGEESGLAFSSLKGLAIYGYYEIGLARAASALASLLERPYWRRIWIVQEFLLARTVIVHCGFNHASAEHLRAAGHLYGFGVEAGNRDLWNNRNLKIRIEESPGMRLLERRCDGLQQSIHDLLKACQGSKSSEPRDKIYALLGLASDMPKDAITVDYSISL